MNPKINLYFRILILIFPFIPLILAVNERKDLESFVPPIFELTALGLFIFSNLYLLIELFIMKSKTLNIKIKYNIIFILLSNIVFILIVYLFDLWK
ncbi:membrane protein of unknown function [Tenacibaculum jejuense]|uniref:Uncharacterized protein n=1 Tax=Tenacibaculum jejuense TaxID=584609 RepID=A0A238U4A7_9FLAO|nr:membrane protein of unknown function [Tenacibaculum jejuense]